MNAPIKIVGTLRESFGRHSEEAWAALSPRSIRTCGCVLSHTVGPPTPLTGLPQVEEKKKTNLAKFSEVGCTFLSLNIHFA